MTPVLWLAAGAGVIAMVAAIVWASMRRSEAQIFAARLEMQNALSSHSQAMTTQINHLAQAVTQQLGQVRAELQSGVASTGKLASDAQREVAQRLQSSTEVLLKMSQKIGEVHQSSQDLSRAAQTLQSVLGGAKTRGSLGEIALDGILEDALPRSAYETQFRFMSTGAIVDAVVRSGERLLPVDSKFPLDSYRRLVECGEEARREFAAAVRRHADSLAEKYILPDEHTLDYALMFVPSEGVYYELLMTEDSKYGRLDEYCRARRVFPVSPNTFYACLSAIALSLQGQKLEENARHLIAGLGGIRKQLESFAEIYDRLGTHLRHAQLSYDDSGSKLTRVQNSLDQMAQGALPDAPAKALEVSSGQ